MLKKYEESALLSKRVYDLLNTLDILTGDYTILSLGMFDPTIHELFIAY